MREAKLFGIDTLPPDINKSITLWAVEGQNLRYGLSSVSDMGAADSDKLVREREENGDYKSFEEFITRMPTSYPVSSGVALAKGGTFDRVEVREELLAIVPMYDDARRKFAVTMDCGCNKTKTIKPAKDEDDNIADEVTDAQVAAELKKLKCKKHPDAEVQEVEEDDLTYTRAHWLKDHPNENPPQGRTPTRDELLDMETEALFAPLSTGHTVSDYHEFIEARIFTEQEIEELPAKPRNLRKAHEPSQCVVGGEVVNVKVIKTKKKQESMAFVDLVFGTNTYSLTVFPYFYRQYHKLLTKATAILVVGNKGEKNEILVTHIDDVVQVAEEVGWEPPAKVVKMPAGEARAKFKSTRKIKRRVA
jgi:DNA polymerase III subunit alpha